MENSSTSDKETAVDIQLCALSNHKMIAVSVAWSVLPFRSLDAVQNVVATLFDERGRVVLSSCHAVPRGRSVNLIEWMRKLEIQDVR